MPDSFDRPANGFPQAPTDAGFYHEVLDQMNDGVYFVDRDRRIQYWNKAAQQITGYAPAEVVGRFCQENQMCHANENNSDCMCHESCPLSACMSDGQVRESMLFVQNKSGNRVPTLVKIKPMKDVAGSITGAIAILGDDAAHSEVRRKIETMRKLAYLDHLTQMPNRRFLESTLVTAVSEFRMGSEPFGVMVVDLDEFKGINDCFGHLFGDRALRHVCQTLRNSLRPTDTVGRWGGDEFVAIVRRVDLEILKRLADRCVRLVKQTEIEAEAGKGVALSVSIGAVLSREGESVEDILHRADELMYKSKTSGRGCANAG